MCNALVALFALALLTACPPTRSSGDDDDDGGGDWTLEIVNETTFVTIEMVQQRPCPSEDPEDWNEIPLPAGGIADGESHRVLLPTPGCYALSASGNDGCVAEGTTGSLQLGDQTTWAIGEDDVACPG